MKSISNVNQTELLSDEQMLTLEAGLVVPVPTCKNGKKDQPKPTDIVIDPYPEPFPPIVH